MVDGAEIDGPWSCSGVGAIGGIGDTVFAWRRASGDALIHGAASHVGLVRKQNEDSFVAGDGLYAVCDGMGGARAGEVASETACRALLDLQPYAAGRGGASALGRAGANDAIVAQSLKDPGSSAWAPP